MAQRKLQNEIEKCFKKVLEGVQQFEDIHEKIQSSTNPSQKEKLEDALKKEIKKLQRSRDQIKQWASSGEIKDKKELLAKRKLIETQMEKFKAVEKEMKTKAYSKEGLQAAAKLDPKEREKVEAIEFTQQAVEDLQLQVEQMEAEQESVNATMKKGKKDTSKAERIAEIDVKLEQHNFHITTLERILRALENGLLSPDRLKELEDNIRYYVDNNTEVDFMEDDEIYDELGLEELDEQFGLENELDHVSSHDTQSIADDPVEADTRQASVGAGKPKSTSVSESTAAARRPSTQMKSPLPALATLHPPIPTTTSSGPPPTTAKPAPLPTRGTGEPLKYASAAAAAAASDKSGLGLTALPPPLRDTTSATGLSPALAHVTAQSIPSSSPSAVHSHPVPPESQSKATASSVTPPAANENIRNAPIIEQASKKSSDERPVEETMPPSTPSLTNGDTHSDAEEEESIFHLPANLSDLLESFEATKASAFQPLTDPTTQRLFIASGKYYPDGIDSERPQHYRPQNPYPYAPNHYPQEPLSIFDDPRLYSKCDTDTLFYSFYYKQGTYQQYAAAKALKAQSWRFHKQYQTWFQRHEEPKDITEDYEQGTYRFFDYESTWMNRRKADFKFHYKFLEDDC
ncbi:CCR4-NOT transcription complex [Microthyrium microscopicum]|uniref:General negative regulator of transcription subunit n=1 Tax=Microthyrium microscopicum TaxID=703497 RepID=A0A6A6U135_9PEZI|nr:CCR4-NOT transcription complex [Microthyrium microscopicum]